MALATQEAIRDRIYALLEGISPSLLTTPKFRRYRNEGGADFMAWAEGPGISGCLRRFQVRQRGEDGEPDVSNTTEEAVEIEFEILIAYPQTHRYGAANGMDRDDVRKADWKAIKQLIGRNGKGNFPAGSAYDCTPLGASEELQEGKKVDFSSIRMHVRYHRSTT